MFTDCVCKVVVTKAPIPLCHNFLEREIVSVYAFHGLNASVSSIITLVTVESNVAVVVQSRNQKASTGAKVA